VLEEGALLGSNAAVTPLRRVGAWAVVAAGAAAFADVPAGQTLVRLSHRERPAAPGTGREASP
jgi:acetyltransferase-like isoleucine patch superfamily enzyme